MGLLILKVICRYGALIFRIINIKGEMMKYNKPLALLSLLSLSLLSACGGGSSVTSDNNLPSTGGENLLQPHQVSNRNLQSIDVLSRNIFPAPVVTTNADSITISHTLASGQSASNHYQFFLNIDNNAATGFRFDGEAWDKAGTDYVVEDGHLFKSTANDTSWSWNQNVGQVTYKKTASSVSVTIKKTLLRGLTPNIRVGLMTRGTNWNVKNLYPRSSLMAPYHIDISTPPDTEDPVISLKGSSRMVIQKGSVFTDPGATAIDNVDGDISAKITTRSTVNTAKAGEYNIEYKVKDRAGNRGINYRVVTVIDNVPDTITLDGHKEDWFNIPVLSETPAGTIKAANQNGNLYFLIETTDRIDDNFQLFLDTDNDSATGYQFGGDTWNEGGADYMVENDHLNKATANSSSWSWKYDIGTISTAHIYNHILEIKIPTSYLANLSDTRNTINIGFVNRDYSWNVLSALPENGLASYSFTRTQQAFLHTPNVTRITKLHGKWYGIAGDGKTILQDNGTDVSTVYKNESEITSELNWMSGRLYFIEQTSRKNRTLNSFNLTTGNAKKPVSGGFIHIKAVMNNYMLINQLTSCCGGRMHFNNYKKIDRKNNVIDLFRSGFGNRLYIKSVDKPSNIIHINLRIIANHRPVVKHKKITDAVNTGLENE